MAIATVGGVGHLRPAPGTWGTAAAAIPAGLWLVYGPASWLSCGLWVGTAIAVLAGLLSCGAACRRLGLKDPPAVVIDEVAGTWIALALIPSATLAASPLVAVVVASLVFRVFDIAKPWPLSWLEHWPGAVGILADDLAAGMLAGKLTLAALH